jgi:hypothetical protein
MGFRSELRSSTKILTSNFEFRKFRQMPVNSEQILTWIPFSVTTIENSSALNTSVEVAMTKQIITRQTAVILLAKECLWSDTLKG